MTYKRNELSTLILIIMKKLFITLFIALILSSCASFKAYTVVDYIDYSVFSQNGIFATELSSVNFDYRAIGSLSVRMYNGTVKKEQTIEREKRGDDLYSGTSKNSWKTTIPEEIYQKVCDEIRSKGGNGIVNMKLSLIPMDKNNPRGGLMVSGMVIRK